MMIFLQTLEPFHSKLKCRKERGEDGLRKKLETQKTRAEAIKSRKWGNKKRRRKRRMTKGERKREREKKKETDNDGR